MITLIEEIKQGHVWDFHGGIHPPENKRQSSETSILPADIPNEIVLPTKQHIGTAGQLLVNVGDKVLKGQPLTKSDILQCCPVHAPTSGEVVAIEPRTIAHASGLTDNCIVIKPDFEDTWGDKNALPDFREVSDEALIDHVRMMGIAGMGGAGFPAARKLQTGHARTEILIINGAECEPYITADDRLMQERADEIVQGIEILQHIVSPKLTVMALEDNKPEAIDALKLATQGKPDIVVQVVPTKYPSGGEKQLIKLITGKEVPAKAIPAAIGVMMQNVGTVFAIKRAVIDGEPLIERVVTLTGTTLKEQRNRWALLGTPVSFLLDKHGYEPDKKVERVIIGGPMMGYTIPHPNVPVTKVTNCVLVPSRREIAPSEGEMACIRCSACAEACPASLLPQQLQWYAKDQDYDKCEEYNLFDCIECGACAFVCPSEIPLVQYYRQAKSEIRARDAEQQAAERAKERFEAKKARMERDKKAREERHKQAAENRRKAMEKSGEGDAIAAAIARVKAKSENESAATAMKPAVAAAIAKAKAKQAEAAAQGQTEPDNSEMAKLREERKRQARERKAQKASESETENATDDKKDAVAAAIARAKARKAAQQSESEPASDNSAAGEDPKKAAVAAAIARAKARKEAQQVDAATPTADSAPEEQAPIEEDPKKAAVAAAIARAKARKAAQEAEAEAPATDSAPLETPVEEDPKKAAVAAAVARAKARKVAQQEKAEPPTADSAPVEVTPAEDDPKKAAVAAAVARAKARKAAQQAEAEAPAVDVAPVDEAPVEDNPKKAAVAAAVARAKARKAAQQAEVEAPTSEAAPVEDTPVKEDPKKAAVAAAIARAKARKAAQMKNKNEEE
ncbi:electron transport complex subunit RsxC [Grimontia kaedaensis]|uniref:Ion-translocating oxidoreductase complex subunit C n=1 Tax=Grimontia kaedaensis TaxID=2872157 RepID=A0ABY4WPT0_9GAMM|nr:electron transport complex subunit RsxC [Grimontia kaedaensis]USH01598.1 electron transport complex subunit RsxC [Grimontia kaedaensis]